MSTGVDTRADTVADLSQSYLDLLERALTHTLYEPSDVAGPSRHPLLRRFREQLRRRGVVFVRLSPESEAMREDGRDWPLYAQTMVGTKRLSHLRECVEQLLDEGIPGDLIETGVWRGGASILMRGVLRARDVRDRSVYVADSFAGLPPPQQEYPADATSRFHEETQLAVSRPEVEEYFRRYGLLDDQVKFMEGFFHETLPALRGHRWALLRLDGDLYGSTMVALTNLYDGLSEGGYVIVDDYNSIDVCAKAVDDFRADRGISDPIQEIDWTGVYWRKAAG